MRRLFSLLLLIFTAASVAIAGETGSQESDPTPSESTIVGRSADDVVSDLAKRLSLTEEQKSKILPIIIERRRKIQEVWTSSTLFVRQKQGQVSRFMSSRTKCLSLKERLSLPRPPR
jgi:hypothetical protein